MLKAADFTTIQLQACIFTPGLEFQATRLLKVLLEKYEKTFDGEPVILPAFPTPAPIEVPKFFLQSKNGGHRLQVGSGRTDLLQVNENCHKPYQAKEFFTWSQNIFRDFLRDTRATAGRLAALTSRKVHANKPGMKIAEHFCKPELLNGPLNRPSDFEVHAAKRFELLAGLQVNSWFRCKSAILVSDPSAHIILVEQDLNTLQEESNTREFGAKDRGSFFRQASSSLQEVLGLYFPNGGDDQ
jgi:hypothetical protein